MNFIYFDSAATTKPSEAAVIAAKEALEIYGNPSSVHSEGLNAKRLIDSARKSVATALYAKPDEIIFTGGGSESNNQAIYGAAKLRSRRSKRIITTDSEHPSVSLPIAALESEGWEVVKIPTLNGKLDLSALETALKDGAAVVSIMLANNETGAKYDIAAVRRAIEKSGSGALFHCDAIQGFLKTADKKEITRNCDLASISAHKVGGFKGVGALYIKNGIKLPAFIRGGGQESGLRSGTENTVGIAAFGAACGDYNAEKLAHISGLYNYLSCALKESGSGIILHTPETRVETILSVSVLGVRSEVMLNALNAEGICISAGSACSARKGPSGALAAYGLGKDEIESALRISFGPDNTKEECDILASRLVANAARLRR